MFVDSLPCSHGVSAPHHVDRAHTARAEIDAAYEGELAVRSAAATDRLAHDVVVAARPVVGASGADVDLVEAVLIRDAIAHCLAAYAHGFIRAEASTLTIAIANVAERRPAV